MLTELLLLLTCLAGSGTTTPAPAAPITMQAVPQLLASIEERLRGLSEAINTGQVGRSFSRSGAGVWGEGGVEALARRLEAVETRLARLDTLIELRFDKLSETLGGRQMKDELAAEQLGRKLDATAERLNHKIGYLEARVDVGAAKIIARIEALPHELQRTSNVEHPPSHSCCHQLQMALGATESRLRAQVDRLSEHVRGSHNAGAQSDANGPRWDVSEHAQNLSRALKDVLKTGRDKMIESIDIEAKNVGIKMTGMCSELWRRSQGIEEMVKQSVAVSNATQRQVQEALRSLGRSRYEQPPAVLAGVCRGSDLEELNARLQKRITDLGLRFDSSFNMMMTAQNMFLESCYRIQLGEPQLEAHLSLVLEHMLDAITNRSSGLNGELQYLREAMQSQGAQTSRSIALMRNTVMQATEQGNQDSKSIASAIEHLGGLTEDRLTQLLAHTPSAESVANLVIMDLKPLLLKAPETVCTPEPVTSKINQPLIEEAMNSTSTNKTADSDYDANEVTPEDNEEEEEMELEDEVIVPEESLFPNFNYNESVGSLWRSMRDNMSLKELLQSMVNREESLVPTHPTLTLDKDTNQEETTEDLTTISYTPEN